MNFVFHKNTIILASALIYNRQKKVLLLQRSQNNKTFRGLWQLPEGKIKFGEHIQKTLSRELKEETNLKLKTLKLQSVQDGLIRSRGQLFHVIRIIFITGVSGKIKLSKEHFAWDWFDPKKLKPCEVFPDTKKIILAANNFN